jgi:dihydropyrimidine dehydrogenase (NAD+) subunit PreT
MGAVPRLPAGRLEERFTEKKPLYTPAEALAEANRCLYCVDAPCIKACPTSIDIPTFIRKIATDNVKGAARTILTANLLGESCGQVCPVEVLCAGDCVYNDWGRDPIKIGRLQHFAVTETLKRDPALFTRKATTGKKVALVGAGPASIAAAGYLALEGHEAVIFEKKAIPGGLNTLGIAPYKMKGDAALAEIEWVLSLGGIELRTGVEVVKGEAGAGQVSSADLLRDYDAVFLGLGLGPDSHLAIAGEEGEGVVGAVALIERMKADASLKLEGVKQAIVVGGGNTALDALHELALLGIETTMVYRRTEAEMTGYKHELAGARLDSGRLIENRVPVSVVREGSALKALRVAHAKDGRAIPGTEEDLATDLIVVAIGQSRATQVALAFEGVVVDSKGRVVVDAATHRTGNARVYSGGDCVNGGKEVVNAVAEAKVAVRAMHAQLLTLGPQAAPDPGALRTPVMGA